MADTVHHELLEAENELEFLARALYRFSGKGDWLEGKPSDMLAGASHIADNVRKRLRRITDCEVVLDIKIPEENQSKKEEA